MITNDIERVLKGNRARVPKSTAADLVLTFKTYKNHITLITAEVKFHE